MLFSLAVGMGLLLLAWSADKFVLSASALARHWGVSPLVIGLTIVAFGTSAPELLVSAMAAWQGNMGLAVGNAIGSNIANIGLVLGLSVLVWPIKVHKTTLRRELPLLLLVSFGVYVLFIDGQLQRGDGLLLWSTLGVSLWWRMRQKSTVPVEQKADADYGLLWFFSSLGLLLLASKLLLWGAVGLAQQWAISDEVIGLTLVAVGTSFPELATSMVAARQRQHGIALGNVLGSNFFNLLAVLGTAAIFRPAPLSQNLVVLDYPLMLAFTVLLFALACFGRLQRWHGVLLLLAFFAYLGWLFMPHSTILSLR